MEKFKKGSQHFFERIVKHQPDPGKGSFKKAKIVNEIYEHLCKTLNVSLSKSKFKLCINLKDQLKTKK